jgi:hypothetical protein
MSKHISDLVVEQNRSECKRMICDGINRSYFDADVFSYAVQLIRTNLIQNITEVTAAIILDEMQGESTERNTASLREWLMVLDAMNETLHPLSLTKEVSSLVRTYGKEQ